MTARDLPAVRRQSDAQRRRVGHHEQRDEASSRPHRGAPFPQAQRPSRLDDVTADLEPRRHDPAQHPGREPRSLGRTAPQGAVTVELVASVDQTFGPRARSSRSTRSQTSRGSIDRPLGKPDLRRGNAQHAEQRRDDQRRARHPAGESRQILHRRGHRPAISDQAAWQDRQGLDQEQQPVQPDRSRSARTPSGLPPAGVVNAAGERPIRCSRSPSRSRPRSPSPAAARARAGRSPSDRPQCPQRPFGNPRLQRRGLFTHYSRKIQNSKIQEGLWISRSSWRMFTISNGFQSSS